MADSVSTADFSHSGRDEASPGGDAERTGRGPASGAALGDALGNREEGKEGSKGTLGPDGSLVSATVAQPPQSSAGDSSNTPFSKTISSGGEDWLEVSLYVIHATFLDTSRRLDAARAAAQSKQQGADELELGGVRFRVVPESTAMGGRAGVVFRWRLVGQNGLVIMLMNRAIPHKTMPNASVRATSLQLMTDGVHKVWSDVTKALAALGITIVANKLSRVDACVDLLGVAVQNFIDPYRQGHYVMRPRHGEDRAVESHVDVHRFGQEETSFSVGLGAVKLRVYDKIREVGSDHEKLEVLIERRYGEWCKDATRVEYQLRRDKLKELGIDAFEDWLDKRGAVCAHLTTQWFRLVHGPVDRNHANRAPTLPLWERVQQSFAEWTGASDGRELAPLATTPPRPVHLIKQAVGLLLTALVRMRRSVASNEDFEHEAMCMVVDAIEDRDMAAEAKRKTLELCIMPRSGGMDSGGQA